MPEKPQQEHQEKTREKRKNDPSRDIAGKLWILPALILVGALISVWQPVSLNALLTWGRELSANPVFIGAIVLTMVLMFSFGLPGSFAVWLIAPFQPPLIATALLVTGSVLGALGAYAFSRRLRGDWQPAGLAGRVVQLLERRGGVMTQTALRILPGFPHSVINFAGGLLLLPLMAFTVSAIVGLTVKWGVYATAVHGLADAVESGQAMQASTLYPLLILSALLLAGAWARARLEAQAAP